MRVMSRREGGAQEEGSMKTMNSTTFYIGLGAAAVVAALFYWSYGPTKNVEQVRAIPASQLSDLAKLGERAFNDNCIACHGPKGSGTDKGPPLIHQIYNPGHHSDEAFYRAVARGSRQHHWPFGNMPPQPQVSRDEVTQIIAYIRQLQAASGIHYKPHRM